jgi:TatD DNase family protein
MIFDSHAHYDDEAYNEDRDAVIGRLKEEGVEALVNIGASIEGSESSIALAKKYPFIYATIGVHPENIKTMTEDDIDWLREHSKEEKVVAIGEIGLDYYWDKDNKEDQKKWFRKQIALAKETNLPIAIHSRDAAADTINILKEEHVEEIGGIIHCYSYSKESVKDYLKLGLYVGIGGVLTFKNGRKLREAVEEIPLERIVLETDAPYLAPDPYRGKRNNSAYLKYVVDKIAEIKETSTEEVIRITTQNTYDVYRIERD